MCCLSFCPGPLASALTNRFGFRAVVFAGGVAAAAGCVLSAFSPQLFYVLLAFGLLGGKRYRRYWVYIEIFHIHLLCMIHEIASQ